ncbi:MAG: polysaccharide deacetylase family protein [Acidimicrobiia bacterium]|nr:polysaccharide deacetylase family protein [Acidimicrobiia bacterium]MYC46354.1 polysaccharide deacetylase family protein [Acidimicrobiia bacterium]
MKWRPTLAALAVLAAVGALAVAMSSGSVPAASASMDDPGGEPASAAPPVQPMAAAAEPEPIERPDTVTAVVEEDLAEAAPPPEEADEGELPGEEDPPAADSPDAVGEDEDEAAPNAVDATLRNVIPTICPNPSDPFFTLYRPGENCYWLRFEEELHRNLSEEELALAESVPFVAGHVAEPLGRPARIIRRGPSGESGAPRFYLTFDDGPSTRWTRPTLDLLDRHGARATFFPLGAHAEVNFHIIEEIVARGHTIGSHLWSHERAALESEELFRRELRASAELYGELGTNCLRTPFGILSDDIAEWAGDEGFEILHWGEPDPRDWEFPGVEELTRSMLDMQNGSILILHEHTGADTLAALDAVLEVLGARGWRFDEPICPLQF